MQTDARVGKFQPGHFLSADRLKQSTDYADYTDYVIVLRNLWMPSLTVGLLKLQGRLTSTGSDKALISVSRCT